MNEFLITFTPEFKREYKHLAKKHASLDTDMQALVEKLKANPTLGTALGNNAYKIRLAISSKNKGKSGGPRRAAQGSLRILLVKITSCIFFPFMINPIRPLSLMKAFGY